MIHYMLRCVGGHEFDGWFPGSGAFETQCAARQIECPHCGSADVLRGLMAPALSQGRPDTPLREAKAAEPGPRLPAEAVAMLQKLRQAVEKTCENVGAAFPDQARMMHNGEIELRGIYGEASADEAAALHEEGIEVTRLPWVKHADS